MDNTERLWSIQDTATYLHVAEKTVTRMIQRGDLPAVRLGGQWRFVPDQITQWLQSKGTTPESVRDLIRLDPLAVPFDRLLKPEQIICRSKASHTQAVLSELSYAVSRTFPQVNPDDYLRSLLAREELAPTSLGNGLAVPHIRQPEENPTGSMELFLLTTDTPIHHGKDYCSVFCLVCTDDLVLHLRLIQKIGYALRNEDVTDILQEQKDPESVIIAIIEAERKKENE